MAKSRLVATYFLEIDLQHSALGLVGFSVKPLIIVALFALLSSCAAPVVNNAQSPADFATRCADPNVIRCFGFEKDELSTHGGPIFWSAHLAPVGSFVNGMEDGTDLGGRVEIAEDQKASGESSLKFFMPSQTGSSFAGQFYANFSDDYSVQFGEGEEFYIQWRQQFSKEFLKNRYRPRSNWKQLIVGEGNRPGRPAWSCTQLELVVKQDNYGSPAMYHSCGGKDGQYEPIFQDWSVYYEADQWMTFQLVVKIGTWYKNDREYHHDSLIELWVAPQGEQSRRVISHKYDLANNDPLAKYGKVWLLPYLTGKDASQVHAEAYTWYDELIISRAAIADPI
jgi:hypothetical protein